MKKKIYIFPIKANKSILNPYVNHLVESLGLNNEISNNCGRNYGIFDLILYLRCDVFIFNWTENLPKLKFGFLQTLNYVIITLIIKTFKSKQIIWILHNKRIHNKKNYLSGAIMNYNSRIANFVITHAKDGLAFYRDTYKKDNIVYTPHPIYENVKPILNIPLIYDFILWGNIEPYKNITEFLIFIKNKNYYTDKKILICGKCNDENYLREINNHITPNIIFIDEYIDDNKLSKFISESKVVLFCHSSTSILSSGALIYSLSFLKPIIGPNIGAFKEYKDLDIIQTYNEFDEIESLVEQFKHNDARISEHLIQNTWYNFKGFIENLLEK
ncbi:hypothetical protein [Flavobacterium maritimum]|uniref:hypothetical protein n=1 Tax=Flavobacterium maritimum TaxID=3149042 RepID=UPI0032B5D262